jgi:hypothetical protein
MLYSNMKTQHKHHLIILFFVIFVFIVNLTLFYLPHIKGFYFINYTQDERFQINLKGEDYLEVFFAHDYWSSIHNEYHPLVRGEPHRNVEYKTDNLTKQHFQIFEIVENDDIKIETKLSTVNSQNFKLRRKYEIKNEYLIEDLNTLYMQLIIGSENHTFSPTETKLNLTQCDLTIGMVEDLNTKYYYKEKFLEISKEITENMKEEGHYTINLNFNLDCE